MRTIFSCVLAGSLLAVTVYGDPARSKPRPVDLVLESSRGGTRPLASFRGRVVVVFYEDKSHSDVNNGIKEAVGRTILEKDWSGRVAVLGIANVRGYGFFPVKNIVRGVIRDIAEKHGVEILIDWEGSSDAALGVVNDDANVVVIDRAGYVRFSKRGPLQKADERTILTNVGASLE